MQINILGKDIELKYSFKALMIFENIKGESFNPQTISDIIIFFYSVILGSDRNLSLEFDDFISWLDDNPEKMTEFSSWLSSVVSKNKFISPEITEKEIKKAKKESKKNS